MIQLPNNCSCSELQVSPSNWKKTSVSVKKPWRIHYRFYDPSFDKPRQVTIKAGINKIKDLNQRRTLVLQLIEAEIKKLQEGYNPFNEELEEPVHIAIEIPPTTPFIDALRKAMDKIPIGDRTKVDVKSVINGVEKAAKQLRIAGLPISSISRKHLKKILEQCGKINPRWSARRYNIYRAYLLMLFKELVELETTKFNPVRDISKMKETKKLRRVLTTKQREQINNYLKEVDYRFHIFVHLFFHSGARLQELVQLRKADVDLVNQKYKTTIRKGKSYKEVERTIKNAALPYWEEFIKEAAEDDYLFGINFLPAKKAIVPNTITRRWHKWVKEKLGIQVDLYSLKHLNTTETVTYAGEEVAAKQNAHTTTAMVISTYDVHRMERQHQILKSVNNKFA